MGLHADLYDLIYSYNVKQAICLANQNYKPDNKGKGFFINYSGKELVDLVHKIRYSKIMLKMGFTQLEMDFVTTTLCVHYCVPNFDLISTIEGKIPDIESRLKKSKYIVHKDLPLMDLKNLLKGEEIRKPK